MLHLDVHLHPEYFIFPFQLKWPIMAFLQCAVKGRSAITSQFLKRKPPPKEGQTGLELNEDKHAGFLVF